MRLVTPAAAGLLLLLAPAVRAQSPADSARAVFAVQRPLERVPVEPLLPIRSVREAAALHPAFRRDLATATLTFRSRTGGGLVAVQEPVFVVDGVRRLGGPIGASTLGLLGAPDVPFAAVAPFGGVRGSAVLGGSVEALGGFVPASIGEAGGGIVRVTTSDGAGRFGARVEGLSSRATDAYGSSLASATVRGPLGRSAGFSVTGEARRAADAMPSAGETLRLTDAAYARLQDAPQTIIVRDAAGVRTVPFPTAAALAAIRAGQTFTVPDALAALGLGPDATLEDAQPLDAASALTEADVERGRVQDDPLTDLALTGQAAATLPILGSVRAGGSLFRREASATAATPAEAFGRRFAARDALSRQTADGASAFVAADQIALPAGVFASARASFETAGSVLHPAAFSANVADALGYGDADDDVFAAAQRYLVFFTGAGYVPRYTFDGAGGLPTRPITGFALPGTAAGTYDRQRATSTQAAAEISRSGGRLYRLSAGAEVEVQTFRRLTLDGLSLATYANDGNGLPILGFPNGVDAYDDLDFDALRNAVRTAYGYSFNGLETTYDESVADYFQDATGRRANTDVAAFRPLTTAGYVRGQFEIGRFETGGGVQFDLGLRLERYDARATTLFDPFAAVAVQRAGALPDAPAGIGDDFAVYYADNGATRVGFRDREGQFYDATGTPATPDAILADARGAVRQLSDGTLADVFAPTRATTRVQPRVGARAYVTPDVLVSGYAMRASRRPDPGLYIPFSAYDQLSGATALSGNAALRPEDVRAAGVGARVRLSPRAYVGAEAFARQTRDLPEFGAFVGGLPAYAGVRSTGSRDEVGVDLTAQVSPAEGAAVSAAYTFTRTTPAAEGTRHALTVAAEARTPEALGLLGGFGVGVVVQAQSGLPYTAFQANDRFSVFDPFTPDVAGEIDGARLPWTLQADVRVERRVALGAGSVTAFVWAENVLGTRNTLAVYRATGRPDADGFPATPNGQQVLDTPGRVLLYEGYTGGPVNVGGAQSTGAPFVYGQPRQVRLGVVLGL